MNKYSFDFKKIHYNRYWNCAFLNYNYDEFYFIFFDDNTALECNVYGCERAIRQNTIFELKDYSCFNDQEIAYSSSRFIPIILKLIKNINDEYEKKILIQFKKNNKKVNEWSFYYE